MRLFTLAHFLWTPAGHYMFVFFILPLLLQAGFNEKYSWFLTSPCMCVCVCVRERALLFTVFTMETTDGWIRMTMADIIIQIVLVVADREAWWWWWCLFLWNPNKPLGSVFGLIFFIFLLPSFPEAVNISRRTFVIKMSPGITWFGKSRGDSVLCYTVTVNGLANTVAVM